MDLENRSVFFFCIERAVARADDATTAIESAKEKRLR
jgi:hypothetical protein